MQGISKEQVEEVRAGGNGSALFAPQPGGQVLRLVYYKGMLRVDKHRDGAKIPLPARGVGGSDSPLTSRP